MRDNTKLKKLVNKLESSLHFYFVSDIVRGRRYTNKFPFEVMIQFLFI